MSMLGKLFLLLFLFIDPGLGSDIPTEDGVLVLTTDNFKEAIELNELILVEFYAPWCGHCKALAPEYSKAAEILSEKESKIKLAKIDAQAHRQYADTYGVRGYPTMKYFRQGVPIDYKGGRQAEGVINWVESKAEPPFTPLNSGEDIERFIEDNTVSVVGFFENKENAKAKVFLEVANNMDDIRFGFVSDANLFGKYEITEEEIVLFKSFDERRNDYNGNADAEDLEKFVRTNSFPLVIEFEQKIAPKLFTGDILNALFLFVSSSSDDYGSQKDMATKIAKEFKGKVMIILLDTDDQNLEKFLNLLGIQKDEIPGMRLMFGVKDTYGPDVGGIDENNVRKFLQDYLDGKLNPRRWLKSEDIPSDWNEGPVTTLVGRNFHEVINGDKTVYVMFYAPWCGHCKNLHPTWNELGKKYEGHDKVIIAKMDATANDLVDLAISSYPTVKIFKGSIESAVDSKERDLGAMVNFLRAHWIKLDPEASSKKKDSEENKKDEL